MMIKYTIFVICHYIKHTILSIHRNFDIQRKNFTRCIDECSHINVLTQRFSTTPFFYLYNYIVNSHHCRNILSGVDESGILFLLFLHKEFYELFWILDTYQIQIRNIKFKLETRFDFFHGECIFWCHNLCHKLYCNWGKSVVMFEQSQQQII